MTRFVVPAFLACALLGSSLTATAQNAPRPYPTILVSLPPAKPTPTPDPSATLRTIVRVRVTVCANERKIAESALGQTAYSDGVVVGVMQRLGDTKFTLDDLVTNQLPDYGMPTPQPAGLPNLPSPIPFSTPYLAPIWVARNASKPYWTGTRKLLDASGDLETSVRQSATTVDKLQAIVNTDPDPERRKAVQATIAALTDAIVRQAPLVKKINEFIIKADTNLSVSEMRQVGGMSGANPQPATGASSLLMSSDPESEGYKLLHESKSAHEATVKAVHAAEEMNKSAFAECPAPTPAPHPQATSR